MTRIEPVRVAIFLSGSGSNFQALLDATRSKRLQATVVCVASNRSDAYGLVRAKDASIPTIHLSSPMTEQAIDQLAQTLTDFRVECILLAGFLRKVPEKILRMYSRRILNIHPALLPKFGGKGMYGHHVHEAVIASGATESGATVHLVDSEYDTGEILAQQSVLVFLNDTAESLARRVLDVEHELYPRTVQQFLEREFAVAPITSAHH